MCCAYSYTCRAPEHPGPRGVGALDPAPHPRLLPTGMQYKQYSKPSSPFLFDCKTQLPRLCDTSIQPISLIFISFLLPLFLLPFFSLFAETVLAVRQVRGRDHDCAALPALRGHSLSQERHQRARQGSQRLRGRAGSYARLHCRRFGCFSWSMLQFAGFMHTAPCSCCCLHF